MIIIKGLIYTSRNKRIMNYNSICGINGMIRKSNNSKRILEHKYHQRKIRKDIEDPILKYLESHATPKGIVI
jgi:hypothetical protein